MMNNVKLHRVVLIIIAIVVLVACIVQPQDSIPFSPLSIVSPLSYNNDVNFPYVPNYNAGDRGKVRLTLRFFLDSNGNRIRDKGEGQVIGFTYILRYFDPVSFRGAMLESTTDINGSDSFPSPGYGLYRIRIGTFSRFQEIYVFIFDGKKHSYDIPVPLSILGAQVINRDIYFPLLVETGTCHSNWITIQMAEIFLTDFRQKRSQSVCNDNLSQLAQWRAEDMAIRGYESHTTPDGYGPNYLAEKYGCDLPDYYGQDLDSNNIESIAGGMNSPLAAWAALMLSNSHRLHLLGEGGYAKQDQHGFGYARILGSRFQYYYVYITAECL